MIADSKAPIVVVGAGYVGLVTAIGLASHRRVRLVETEAKRLAPLERGEVPFDEPGLQERFDALKSGRLVLFKDIHRALVDNREQLVFVAVGTPPRDPADERTPNKSDASVGRAPDLRAVNAVVDSLFAYRRVAVVMKSTVPPGTGQKALERARASGSDLEYVSCPEFLREGEAFRCLDKPDRILIGRSGSSWATDELRLLHEELYPEIETEDMDSQSEPAREVPLAFDGERAPRYLERDLQSVEALKLVSNLCLATRIAIANQIANYCEEVDADVRVVMEGVGADSRIGSAFFDAGLGWGGSCFDKDINALDFVAHEANVDLTIARTVLSINADQPLRAVNKLERRIGDLTGVRVAILGVTFKPGTDDLRGSPAFALAQELRGRRATVRAWDPSSRALERAEGHWRAATDGSETSPEGSGAGNEWLAPEEIADSALHAMKRADVVVLATAWPELLELDWRDAAKVMSGKLVIDGRNSLSHHDVCAAGLEYEGVGRHSAGLYRMPSAEELERRSSETESSL